jgi:hypothetical protein
MYDLILTNRSGIGSVGAAALLACLSSAELKPPKGIEQLVNQPGASATSRSLTNRSAALSLRIRNVEQDYVLDSPNFVPSQLRRFAASGFVRKNRWS